MYENIGSKIKVLAKALCSIGFIVSFLIGIMFIRVGLDESSYIEELGIMLGISHMAFGALFSWVGYFVLYGFGQLIENSQVIREIAEKNNTKNSTENAN